MATLFVPVIVVCSLLHGVPSEEGSYCASDRPVDLADRNLEQCLIRGLEVVRKYGGQDDVSSFGCEEMNADGSDPNAGQPHGATAR